MFAVDEVEKESFGDCRAKRPVDNLELEAGGVVVVQQLGMRRVVATDGRGTKLPPPP